MQYISSVAPLDQIILENEPIIQSKSEQSIQEKILESKPFPLIIMALVIFFFFYVIPEHIAERFDIFFAIVGGTMMIFLSVWSIERLSTKFFDKMPTITALCCISTLFIFGCCFISKTSRFAVKEIRENGIFTEAVILNKNIFYGKRGRRIYNMRVSFTTEKNQHYTTNINLTENEYEDFQSGRIVPIYYSSDHPNITSIDYKTLYKNKRSFLTTH